MFFGGGGGSMHSHLHPSPPPPMLAKGPSPPGAARNPDAAPPTCGTGPASASVSLRRQEGIPINLPPLAAIPAVTSRQRHPSRRCRSGGTFSHAGVSDEQESAPQTRAAADSTRRGCSQRLGRAPGAARQERARGCTLLAR